MHHLCHAPLRLCHAPRQHEHRPRLPPWVRTCSRPCRPLGSRWLAASLAGATMLSHSTRRGGRSRGVHLHARARPVQGITASSCRRDFRDRRCSLRLLSLLPALPASCSAGPLRFLSGTHCSFLLPHGAQGEGRVIRGAYRGQRGSSSRRGQDAFAMQANRRVPRSQAPARRGSWTRRRGAQRWLGGTLASASL